jgi:hypothetical protein
MSKKPAIQLLFSILTLTGFSSAYANNSSCDIGNNTFQLNASHVNSLISLACSGLTHIEVERKNMIYRDGATLFHKWNTSISDRKIKVEGFCSLPLNSLYAKNKDRFKINLEFSENPKFEEKKSILVKGTIAGKSLHLSVNQNDFIDSDCPNSLASSKRLQHIGLGLSFGSDHFMQNLKDILVSQRSGATLNSLEISNWPYIYQSGGANFQGLALQYTLNLWSGRRLGVFATTGEAPGEIRVRTANILEHLEGGRFFAFHTSYGEIGGFSDANKDNHIFKASSYGPFSEVKGCSSLIFDGELSLPKPVNYNLCMRTMEQ